MTQEKYERASDLQDKIYDIEEVLEDARTGRSVENSGSKLSVGDTIIELPPAFTSFVLDAIEKRATTELARLRAEFEKL